MINIFRFNVETCVYFGRHCLEQKKDIFNKYVGVYGNRACIVTSKFQGGNKNLALEEVTKTFDELGIEYIVFDGVEENPPVENVASFRAEAEAFKPDLMIGVGGGSALDSAKALGMLLQHPGVDPVEVFFGPGCPQDNIKTALKMPMFAFPTTCGTGSEVTGGAVLTRNDIHTKEAMYMWAFPSVSFVDPRYTKGAPLYLLDTGVMDALAHGLEASVHVDANFLNKGLAKMAFGLFAGFKDHLREGLDALTDDDYDNMCLASLTQGLAFMNACTTIPHGLSYPLSHYKNVNHGLSCSLFLGEYFRNFHDQSLVQPLMEDCGFADSHEFADFVKEVTNRDVHITVTEAEIDKWTDDFMTMPSFQWRFAANPEKLTREDIHRIYHRSLEAYIVK